MKPRTRDSTVRSKRAYDRGSRAPLSTASGSRARCAQAPFHNCADPRWMCVISTRRGNGYRAFPHTESHNLPTVPPTISNPPLTTAPLLSFLPTYKVINVGDRERSAWTRADWTFNQSRIKVFRDSATRRTKIYAHICEIYSGAVYVYRCICICIYMHTYARGTKAK